jgi:hypothetical protein
MAVDWSEEVNSSAAGSPSRRRGRRLFWWVILTPLAALILFGVSLRHHWRAEFHKRVEAIRAAGFPVTSQELDAWYPWPQMGQNAAQWVFGADECCFKLGQQKDSRQLEQLVSRGAERVGPTEPMPDDLKALLERHIESNAKALGMLHEAAAIAECRYPVDLSTTPTTLNHIAIVRDACLLLSLEAVLHAERRDPNGAAAAIEAALGVARSLDNEPVMGSQMVRMWGSVWAATALERALCQVEFTDGQLARLRHAFGSIHASDGLLRALAGYRCMLLVAFEKPQALDEQSWGRLPPVPLLEAYDALGLSAREGAIFLDYMDECIRTARLSAFQRLGAIQTVDAHYPRRGVVLLMSKIGPLSRHIQLDAKGAAWLDMAVTALGVQRHRLAQGRPPETLDQLVPTYLEAVPEDPFDGKPLRYERLGRGFVVYSVGEDGRDDGGAEETSKEMNRAGRTWDLVFTVERPSPPKENAGTQ